MENISKLINLKDRYALITGATGSLGLSIASTFGLENSEGEFKQAVSIRLFSKNR